MLNNKGTRLSVRRSTSICLLLKNKRPDEVPTGVQAYAKK